MKKHVVILGAGFAGLELAARLSESLADAVAVTLIDQSDSFYFGFAKLAVLLGQKEPADVLMHYRDIALDGVEFRQETVTAIDPESRRVTTDQGSYDADFLAIALGAEYDIAATPGFEEGGFEYYTLPGAERLRDALAAFDQGTVLIAILGQPFQCPPAPFEGAFLAHDLFVKRGVRDAVDIRMIFPMAAPVPVTKDVSQIFIHALGERGIEYTPKEVVVSLDPRARGAGGGSSGGGGRTARLGGDAGGTARLGGGGEGTARSADGTSPGTARLASGASVPYDLFIGIPVHRVPDVVERSGLAEGGWVAVDQTNLATRFPGVYALGDVAGGARTVAKAGVFAEAAARVVADDIAARIRSTKPPPPYEGAGDCYIEFGGGMVGKVEANFLSGPAPTARLVGPSRELAADKQAFGATRRERWFGRRAGNG